MKVEKSRRKRRKRRPDLVGSCGNLYWANEKRSGQEYFILEEPPPKEIRKRTRK